MFGKTKHFGLGLNRRRRPEYFFLHFYPLFCIITRHSHTGGRLCSPAGWQHRAAAYSSSSQGGKMRKKFYKLQRRLEDYEVTNDLLAVKLKITAPTLRARFKGTQGWKYSEIITICLLVEIQPGEIGEYFFPDLVA